MFARPAGLVRAVRVVRVHFPRAHVMMLECIGARARTSGESSPLRAHRAE